MPGENLKISTLTERVACEITGNEEFPTEVSNANFRIKLSSYLTWIVTQLTTFVTLTGTQILTNKKLTSPVINSGDAVSVTGTVINFLSGLTANVQQTISGILVRLAGIDSQIATLSSVAGTYSELGALVGGKKTIPASSIYAGNIDVSKVNACFYKKNGDVYTMQDPTAIKLNGNSIYLASVEFDMSTRTVPEDGTVFLFVINYAIIKPVSGVPNITPNIT